MKGLYHVHSRGTGHKALARSREGCSRGATPSAIAEREVGEQGGTQGDCTSQVSIDSVTQRIIRCLAIRDGIPDQCSMTPERPADTTCMMRAKDLDNGLAGHWDGDAGPSCKTAFFRETALN
jgi:hypothetical protein